MVCAILHMQDDLNITIIIDLIKACVLKVEHKALDGQYICVVQAQL